MASSASSQRVDRAEILESILAEVPVRLLPMGAHFTHLVAVVQMLLDLASVLCALALAYKSYRVLGLGTHAYYPKLPYLMTAGVVAIGFVLLMERYGLYRSDSSLLHVRETEAILRGTLMSAAVFIMSGYFFLKLVPSRWIVGLATILVLAMVEMQRAGYFAFLRKLHLLGYGTSRVLIYGCNDTGVEIFRKLVQSPRAGLVPIAFLDDDPENRFRRVQENAYSRRKSIVVAGGSEDLDEILQRLAVTRVIVAGARPESEAFARVLEVCDAKGVRVSYVTQRRSSLEFRVTYQDLDGVMLADLEPWQEPSVYRVTKRAMDLLLTGAVLLFALPVMGLVGLLIWMTDGSPILFYQDRVGLRGRAFRMLKFRTMYKNTPSYAHTPKDQHDPRITPIGRFLRRTSLDELPQLLNVLKGNMSLVGPRPEMPFIVEKYTPEQRQRLMVKPGITGLWQISADRAYEIHENIDYDLYYIRNQSILLDLAILLHTGVFAIRGVGAF